MSNCLRYDLQAYCERTGQSLRKISDGCGVSASTLSRFARGADMTMMNTQRLSSYIRGEVMPDKILIHSRRFEVDGSVFLVSVELLSDK